MKSTLTLLLALFSLNALAESPAVYEKSFDQNLDTAYKAIGESIRRATKDPPANVGGMTLSWVPKCG